MKKNIKMKNILILLGVVLGIAVFATSCGDSKKMKSAETKKENETIMDNRNVKEVYFAGGCFWGTEHFFQQIRGVVGTEVGYANGNKENPTYEEVCSGTTGHAEVVQITYDPNQTNTNEIFKVFFTVHDPTTLNRQGADIGTQYRSVIFYSNEQEKKEAQNIITALESSKVFPSPIVTTIEPLLDFYKAEEYHQDYYNNNKNQPYCKMVIQPKIEKFEKLIKNRLKKE